MIKTRQDKTQVKCYSKLQSQAYSLCVLIQMPCQAYDLKKPIFLLNRNNIIKMIFSLPQDRREDQANELGASSHQTLRAGTLDYALRSPWKEFEVCHFSLNFDPIIYNITLNLNNNNNMSNDFPLHILVTSLKCTPSVVSWQFVLGTWLGKLTKFRKSKIYKETTANFFGGQPKVNRRT